mgnify:CR=1 FL=1
MKIDRRVIVILVFLAMTGFVYAQEGRYQLVAAGDRVFKIDTRTGKTWKYTAVVFTEKPGEREKQITVYYWEEISDIEQAKKDLEYIKKLAEKARHEGK